MISSLIDQAREVSTQSAFSLYTGKLGKAEVSICSTGMGGPPTAIAVEELARCGADTFIRAGTSGGLQSYLRVGDLAINTAAVRCEATSRTYVRDAYPAVASYEVVMALVEASRRLGYRFHVGIARTADSFYSVHPVPGSFGGFWQSWMKDELIDLRRSNVLNAEMEASVIFTLSNLFGLRSGCVCVILGDIVREQSARKLRITGLSTYTEENIVRCCKAAVEAVRVLGKWDEDKRISGETYWSPSLSYRRSR
jgi:uridine phosphorylase